MTLKMAPREESTPSVGTKKRVLVIGTCLNPPGGDACVAANILQAIRGRHRVSFLSWAPADIDATNRFFGTSLTNRDFKVYIARSRWLGLLDRFPLSPPLSLLRISLLARACHAHLDVHPTDVPISTINEMDFGQRGIQYVHFPKEFLPRPEVDLRWYHKPQIALRGYRALCGVIAEMSEERIRANVTLVNSAYVSEKYRQRYAAPATTLFPPVTIAVRPGPWEERENGFVCIGRFSPEKDLEKVIRIVELVRKRGHPVKLCLVGCPDNSWYTRRVFSLAAQHGEWLSIHQNIPRHELCSLLSRNRYGLHGMVGEHFGISVAEMVAAGCIPFVPDEGGPVEIVGGEPRLLYGSVEEAVEKIVRVVENHHDQESLRSYLGARRELFSAERFRDGILRAIEEFDPGRPGGEQPGRSTSERPR